MRFCSSLTLYTLQNMSSKFYFLDDMSTLNWLWKKINFFCRISLPLFSLPYLLFMLSSCASESNSEMAKFALTQPIDAPVAEFDKSVLGTYRTADSIILLNLSHAFNLSSKKIGIHLTESNSKLAISKQAIVNMLDGTLYAYIDSMGDELKARGALPLDDFLIKQLDTLLHSVCKRPTIKYTNPQTKNGYFYIHVSLIDTLFQPSNHQVIKKLNNNFYLNFQDSNLFAWKVLQMAPKGNGITISSMSDEDAYVLRRIIKVKKNAKTGSELLNPDMESFRKFIDLNGFENQVELVKLQ